MYVHQVIFIYCSGTYTSALDWFLFWFFCLINYQHKLIGLRISLIGHDDDETVGLSDRHYMDIIDSIKLHVKTKE